MTSPSARSARECPVCGARNSGLSLFCAECGSVLNGSAETHIPGTGFGTTSGADSQQTQAFLPTTRDNIIKARERWQPPQEPEFSTSASPAQGAGPNPWTPEGPPGAAPQTVAFTSERDGGMRGFVLGIVAMALIAVLLGLYVWAGVLGDGARDAVGGWFDIVGGSGG